MKRILLFAVFLMVQLGFGQTTWTGTTDTNWNTASNWTDGVPDTSDAVTIPNVTNKPTISVAGAVCASLIINNTEGNTNTLTIASPGTLVVGGAITMTEPTNGGTINTTIAVGDGFLSAASISMSNSGNDDRDCILSLSTGTVTISGSITMSGSTDKNQVTFTGAGTLNIGGTMTGGGLTPSTGTVNYNNGGAQTVGTYTYNNLILSGSGAKTFAVTTVSNNLTLSGTATATTGANLAVGGALTVGAGTSLTTGNNFTLTVTGTTSVTGTLALGGTGNKRFDGLVTINAGGTWTNNTSNSLVNFRGGLTNNGTFTSGTGTQTFDTNSQAISGNVTMSNVTVTTVTLTNNGTLTVSSALSVTGTLTNGSTGTLNIGGTAGITTLTATAAGNIVNYNGAAQTVKATTYSNLTLSGSGTKTFSANTVISNLMVVSSGVKVNLNGITTHTTGVLTLGGTGPLSSSWGATGSGAVNTTNTYFTGSGRITINGTAPGSAIDSNYASYSNAIGDLGATVGEYTGPLTLTAPNGTVFINTKFASYGLPNGTYPNFTIGSCHTPESRSITTGLLGNTTATIGTGSFNSIFPDPCYGTSKFYSIVATYAVPICAGTNPGIIDGSTPTGGMGAGTYTFLWEQSTSVNGPYTTVLGTSNAEDYTPSGTLSTTTYYRRTVTSGIYSDATIVVVPVIAAPVTAPTISQLCTNSTLTVAPSSIPGTYVEWFKGIGSCGGTVYATGNSINPTSADTYYARYKNICGQSTCANIVIASAPSNSIVINTATTTAICTSTSIQNTNLAYTLTTGTASTYSIVWNRTPTNYLLDIVDRAISSPIVLNVPANTPAGTFTGTLTVKTSGGCISAGKTFTLTVGKVASVASSTPTVCISTLMPSITHTTINATGIGTPTGLPTGVTAAWASNTITISGTPTQSGTFNYSIPLTGSCSGTVNATGTITVNPLPSAPSVTKVDASCTVSTGSITITAPTGMNYSINGTDYTNTDGIFTSVAAGTYQVTVRNASGCISSATSVNIIPSQLKTWTGTTSTDWHTASNWSPIGVPTDSDCVVIPNATNAIVTSTAYANTLTVQTGGQLTFENNSSLLQDPLSTTNSNSGDITYKRISSPMKNFDYTYWSSPVTGQNIVALSPNTLADKYFRFSGSANDWVLYNDPATSTMIPGVGYIIRTPKEGNPWPNGEIVSFPYSQPLAFKGVPNNGDYSFTAGAGEFNLIGNPYPSAIDATKFMQDNSGIIYGALYFWTHNTPITNNDYTANDYATFNITGGTSTVVTDSAPSTGGTGTVPNGFIAAGQSFFVESQPTPSATEFVFNNGMRATGNNSQFFKQANTKKTATVEKNRVWLNLTNNGGAFKQLLVGYITGATNDWDNLYDGPTFDGQEFVDFYSVNQGKNLTIQGRALPFVDTDVVPLGYRSTIAGSFDISIDNRDGSLAGQAIWLEDKKTNTLHELSKGKYTFTAINGVENDRFVLKYTSKTLGTDDNEVADKSLIVSVKNKKITLTSSAEAITQVQLFDLLGRKVYDKSKINAQEWSISNLPSSEQTLIVKTTLANGAISNKKIIY